MCNYFIWNNKCLRKIFIYLPNFIRKSTSHRELQNQVLNPLNLAISSTYPLSWFRKVGSPGWHHQWAVWPNGMTCRQNERWDPHVNLILTIIKHQLISLWTYMLVEQAFFLTSTVSDRGRNRGCHWSSSIDLGIGEGGDSGGKKTECDSHGELARTTTHMLSPLSLCCPLALWVSSVCVEDATTVWDVATHHVMWAKPPCETGLGG